jgi:fatty acid desaturase
MTRTATARQPEADVPAAPGSVPPIRPHLRGRGGPADLLGLSREKRRALRALHRRRPLWNLVPLLHVGLWGAAAPVMIGSESLAVQLLAFLVCGTALHALGILMHDAIHGSFTGNRKLDRWLGLAMGIPALMTFSGYGIPHYIHHRELGTGKDPDDFRRYAHDDRAHARIFYAWPLLGMAWYSLRMAPLARRLATPRQARELATEQGIQLAVTGGALALGLWFGFLEEVLCAWILPVAAVGMVAGGARGWAEHWTTPGPQPLFQSRTVTSSRLLSFFNCNLNYHLEHHLFPGVPWYNLPKVHALLQDAYRAAGIRSERSYVRLLLRCLRTGPPPLATDPVS